MKTIKGDLIMKEHMVFDEDLKVEGDILGEDGRRYDLKVYGDINCLNINCGNINCDDINCGNINCWNIICWDIDYYAVCFAYNNIKCKSIKGRRDNCKHFVLDGEIEIK